MCFSPECTDRGDEDSLGQWWMMSQVPKAQLPNFQPNAVALAHTDRERVKEDGALPLRTEIIYVQSSEDLVVHMQVKGTLSWIVKHHLKDPFQALGLKPEHAYGFWSLSIIRWNMTFFHTFIHICRSLMYIKYLRLSSVTAPMSLHFPFHTLAGQ